MKANNLTISVPTPGCKQDCPFCVSKMTGCIKSDTTKFKLNLDKARRMAEQSGVNSILVTGKGEPLDQWDFCQHIAINVFNEYPLEIQCHVDNFFDKKPINGEYDSPHLPKTLMEHHLKVVPHYFDTIALSITDLNKTQYIAELRELSERDVIVRATLMVDDNFPFSDFHSILDWAKDAKIDQLSLRNPTIPERLAATEVATTTAAWITNNTKLKKYETIIKDFERRYIQHPVRKLPFGAIIYDIEGIAFTHFDYCVQDSADDDEIRSLIYMQDGHMYTSWTYQSSKIF